MLSPHELATLILIDGASNPHQFDPADLDSLVGKSLVHLEDKACGERLAHLTREGQSLLQAISRRN
jgi:hypothetical protein